MTQTLSFTCPVCGRTSHNPNDVEHGYCGNCHDWTGDPDEHRSVRNQYDQDGWRYGVRFSDGSVASYWNGRTQAQRAAEYLARIIADFGPSYAHPYTLVRHRVGEPWQEVQQMPELG